MVCQQDQLKTDEREIGLRIGQAIQVKEVYQLSPQFIKISKNRKADQLDQWLKDCKASGVSILQSLDPTINVV